uniref:Uncharacterized protein n=1 Tax=Meloidogyne incognita TaxID=6306 RepID=A0A914KVV3_MELIC
MNHNFAAPFKERRKRGRKIGGGRDKITKMRLNFLCCFTARSASNSPILRIFYLLSNNF